MSKGTPSKGKKGQAKQHYRCRRCGKSTYHKKKSVCSNCGYGKSKKLRSYSWQKKSFFKRLNRATKNKRKK